MIPKILILFYVLTSISFITYLFWRKKRILIASRILFGISMGLHLLLLFRLSFQMTGLPMLYPVQAANMMVFFSSLVFLFFTFKRSTAVLGAFFLPIASFVMGLILPYLQADSTYSLTTPQIWYPLHTLTVIGGEALFAVAFVVSIVYLVHDSIIRKGDIHSPASSLPPLKMLDRILSLSMGAGFVAITAGMIFGALWASSAGITYSHLATKASAGSLNWFVFAFSLHQRFAIGWAGKRTAIITILGFVLMILLFIILNFLFPHAHGIGLLR